METWVSIGSLIMVLIAIYAATSRQMSALRNEMRDMRTEFKSDLAEVRAELKGDTEALRAELKGDIGRLEGRIGAMDVRLTSRIETLDSRVYALAVGLRPHLEVAEEAEASS